MRLIRLAPIALLPLLSAACAQDGPGTFGDGGQAAAPAPLVAGVPGVTIERIAMFQTIERVIMQDGAVQQSNIPLVAGREALVRVFYRAEAPYDGGEIIGRLTVDGDAPIEVRQTIAGTSTQAALGSTLNFRVPGARIGETMQFSVAIVREYPAETSPAPEDNAAARWPAAGVEPIAVEGARNVLRLVISPFAYNADGSGRVPDLGAPQLEKIRQRFLSLYPVSDVTIRVREPVSWGGRLGPDGSGWQNIGFELVKHRRADSETEDAYYYGLFNPAATLQRYCGQGCLLGVTLLNDMPADKGNPALRLALGVGFEDVAADTAAHEIGHAHGREHAPCGPGLDPNSIDGDYPHAGAKIGAWGWDVTSNALRAPTMFVDIMSYCPKTFISDHNYAALFNRTQNVNLPRLLVGPPPTNAVAAGRARSRVIAVDASGEATLHEDVDVAPPSGGEPVAVTLFTGPRRAAAGGRLFRFDHMPGGWVFLPPEPAGTAAPRIDRAELFVEGRHVVARRAAAVLP